MNLYLKFFNCMSNVLDSSFILKTTGTFPMGHVFEVKFAVNRKNKIYSWMNTLLYFFSNLSVNGHISIIISSTTLT